MHAILFVADDTTSQCAGRLTAEGFIVTSRPPSSDEVPAGTFDLVIIDLAAAAEDRAAKHYLDASRSGQSPPVIVIIRREDLPSFDPTRGLEDFALERATPDEVVLRVRQCLWKHHQVDTRHILRCGELVMDLVNYTVHVAGRHVELTYKEYELLRFLATNRDRVFTRETLLNKVWGYDFYGGARTVDVHIRRLRSKIEDRHNVFIETVRNVGYRFRVPG